MTRPSVLVVADYYLPGFRAGGPVRAIANSIAHLSQKVVFAVVTRDHDTDRVTYPTVHSGAWNRGPAGTIYYAPRLTRGVLERCIRESSADVIWLNSFFSRATLRVLLARRVGRVAVPVLLAPRGEFSPGALSRKRTRKTLAIAFLRGLGFLRGIQWVASSDLEAGEIRSVAGASPIVVFPESVPEPPAPEIRQPKVRGELRMVFASRIDAKKNLRFLLKALAACRGRIHLDVIGPVEHSDYWQTCRGLIERLPGHVTVEYVGELPHAELGRRLGEYDVMALPTLGENFGHVVVEAWAAGCPVLVSDRTPWRNLQDAGGGWDLPLEQDRWVETLEACVTRDAGAQQVLRHQALERARRAWRDGIRGADEFGQLIVSVARHHHQPHRATPGTPEHQAEATPCR